jgi:hypothetical protein
MLGGDTQETATPVIRADQSPKKIPPVSQPNGDKQIQDWDQAGTADSLVDPVRIWWLGDLGCSRASGAHLTM